MALQECSKCIDAKGIGLRTTAVVRNVPGYTEGVGVDLERLRHCNGVTVHDGKRHFGIVPSSTTVVRPLRSDIHATGVGDIRYVEEQGKLFIRQSQYSLTGTSSRRTTCG